MLDHILRQTIQEWLHDAGSPFPLTHWSLLKLVCTSRYLAQGTLRSSPIHAHPLRGPRGKKVTGQVAIQVVTQYSRDHFETCRCTVVLRYYWNSESVCASPLVGEEVRCVLCSPHATPLK